MTSQQQPQFLSMNFVNKRTYIPQTKQITFRTLQSQPLQQPLSQALPQVQPQSNTKDLTQIQNKLLFRGNMLSNLQGAKPCGSCGGFK